MKKTSFFSAAILAVALSSVSGEAAEQKKTASPRHENTNVILVSLQCLRPDHLGVYGYKRNTSPNFDRLAQSAVLFDNTIAQANLTPVSMMSVLTSQYPRVNGMVAFDVASDTVKSRTLPEILKYYDYTTAAVSGAPEFFMRYDSESGVEIKLGDVFSRSIDQFMRTRKGEGATLRVIPSEALNWIETNRNRKFFLWIASGVLHVPYASGVPTPDKTIFDPPGYTPFWTRFPSISGEEGAPDDTTYDVLMRIFRNQYYLGFKPVHTLTEQDRDFIIGRYDAAVRYTDMFIGDLVRQLEKSGLAKNTLLIVHSVHGEDFGERDTYVHHYDLSEPVIRNALLIRFPAGEYGGKRIKQQVQGIDIVPTVLDYLNIPLDHGLQGNSLVPLSRNDEGARGTEFAFIDRIPWWEHTLSRWYLEFKGAQVRYPKEEVPAIKAYGDKLHQVFPMNAYPPNDIAVRTDRWKLVLRKQARLQGEVSWYSFITAKPLTFPELELFDLAADPLEKTNVADRHPDVVAMLKARLLAWDAENERKKAGYGEGEKRFIIPYP
jgi:arylsulfatase A-like enzyme